MNCYAGVPAASLGSTSSMLACCGAVPRIVCIGSASGAAADMLHCTSHTSLHLGLAMLHVCQLSGTASRRWDNKYPSGANTGTSGSTVPVQGYPPAQGTVTGYPPDMPPTFW